MTRVSWAVVALIALVLGANPPAPAKQPVPGGETLAGQLCVKERKEIGRRAFVKKYGEPGSMQACVRRTRPKVRAATREASRLCEEELAELGHEGFAEEWGTDESGSDAMAECVAYTLDSLLEPPSGEGEGEDGEEEDLA